jgi:3',5'-cyclic AMP phosphodiesterase CpdA
MTRFLVQLSDTHIKAPGARAYGRVDTAALLARAVDAVLALHQPADAVIVTGDLTDGGRADEYAHLRMLLSPLTCPLYLLPGNHDDRGNLRRAFADHAYLRAPAGQDSGFVQYAVDLGGLRLVTLDTVVPNASHGAIDAQRLGHFEAMLAAHARAATIVAMHHPPFATFIAHMDQIGLLEGADALADVVARFPRIERVICGHLHRSIQTRWARTIALTAPSTAHQVCLDLAPDAQAEFVMEPAGFLVHAWSDDGTVVTHQGAIGAFDGPFPFRDVGSATTAGGMETRAADPIPGDEHER